MHDELNDHIGTLQDAIDEMRAKEGALEQARKDIALAVLRLRRILREASSLLGGLEDAVSDVDLDD